MTSKSKPKPQAKISPPEPKPAPAIIVFGPDEANKPRAASFTGGEVEAATKAAELMKLRVLKVAGPELTELAASLQAGRIYASGLGFVPPIRPSIYERLSELADPKPAPSLPRGWDEIEIGHLVLAPENQLVVTLLHYVRILARLSESLGVQPAGLDISIIHTICLQGYTP